MKRSQQNISMRKQSRAYSHDTQAILEANAIFYSAFSTLDYVAMEDLWLPDNTSICIFPSSKPLIGFSAILNSWKHAVQSMDSSFLRNWMAPDDIRFDYLGTNKATIVCDELIFLSTEREIGGKIMQHTDVVNKFRARNMFKKVGNRWYMCYHEAFMPNHRHPDYLALSSSSSADSRSTFLTIMTTNTEREKGRRRSPNQAFFEYIGLSCFGCTGAGS